MVDLFWDLPESDRRRIERIVARAYGRLRKVGMSSVSPVAKEGGELLRPTHNGGTLS